MRYIATTLLLLFLSICHGQETFQRVIDADYATIGNVERDASGNLYSSSLSFYAQGVGSGIQMVKYDASGTPLWNRFLSSPTDFGVFTDHMVVNSTNEVIVTGTVNATGSNPDSAYVAKLNSNGDLAWALRFGADLAGFDGAEGFRLTLASNGDVLVGGIFTFENTQQDIFLARITTTGTVLWTKRIVAPVASTTNRLGGMVEAADGGIIVFGLTTLNTEGSWLLKLDTDGAYQWCRKYNTNTLQALIRPLAAVPTASGYDLFYNTFFSSSNEKLYRISTTATGTVVGSLTYDYGAYTGQVIGVTPITGGYAMAGIVDSETGTGGDAVLFTTNAAGAVQWAMQYGSNGGEAFRSVVPTNNGGYLAGGFGERDSLVEFRGGVPTQSYLVMTDGNGLTGRCERVANVNSSAITFTDAPYLQVVSDVAGWSIQPLVSGSTFSMEEVCTAVGVEARNAVRFSLFPNPTQDRITITGLDNAAWQHQVVDASCRVVLAHASSGDRLELDLRTLSPGVYVLHSTSAGARAVHRLVVER